MAELFVVDWFWFWFVILFYSPFFFLLWWTFWVLCCLRVCFSESDTIMRAVLAATFSCHLIFLVLSMLSLCLDDGLDLVLLELLA